MTPPKVVTDAEALAVLDGNQIFFANGYCPWCGGWMVSENGCTPKVHTKDCAFVKTRDYLASRLQSAVTPNAELAAVIADIRAVAQIFVDSDNMLNDWASRLQAIADREIAPVAWRWLDKPINEESDGLYRTVYDRSSIPPDVVAEAMFLAPPTPAAPGFSAYVAEMECSNGTRVLVMFAKDGDGPLDHKTVREYSPETRYQAEYEAAEWQHWFGNGPEPDILAFAAPAAQKEKGDE
jgi:hypothetical protein